MDPLNGGEPAKALGEAEMDRTADLGAALGFVISRIEEQATRSGKPLTEEQLFLLSNLPHHSATPAFNTGDPEFPIVLCSEGHYLREALCPSKVRASQRP
jgi:hypothetical protein